MDDIEPQDRFRPKKAIISGIVFFLLLISLPVTLFLNQKTQIFKSRADNTQFSCNQEDTDVSAFALNKINPKEQKTVEVNLEDNKRAAADAEEEKNSFFADSDSVIKLRAALIERKNLMLQAMRQNPDAAWKNIQEDGGQDIGAGTEACVEKFTTIEGRLVIEHADFFDEKTSATLYILLADDNQKYYLHHAGQSKTILKPNMKLKVTGYLLDNDLLYNGEDEKSLTILNPDLSFNFNLKKTTNVLGAQTESVTTGNQKVAVILAKFSDTPEPDFTRAQLQAVFDSMKNYYREVSYGKLNLNFDYYGWLTSDLSEQPAEDRFSAILRRVAREIDLSVYKYVVFIAPFESNIGAQGSVGQAVLTDGDRMFNLAYTKINYNLLYGVQWTPLNLEIQTKKFTHEFGHNLGLLHARDLRCANEIISISGCSTSTNVYSDLFDTMGAGSGQGNAHFNSGFKDQLQWLNYEEVKTVSSNGIFVLQPFENLSPGLKVLKIPRGNDTNLYIEYRQPIGIDSLLRPNVFEGALLHLSPGTLILPLIWDAGTLILNGAPPVPGEGMIQTPALLPGKSFTDPLNGNVVEVLRKDSNGLTVKITLGNGPVVQQPIITNAGLNRDKEPWGAWVAGTNLREDLTAQLVDVDGTNWGQGLPITLSGDRSWFSVALPNTSPPSRCNQGKSCTITLKLIDNRNHSSSNSLSLILPSVVSSTPTSTARPVAPSILSGGVNTGYNPWVVWLTGTNLNSNQVVQLFDNGIKWGTDLPVTLSGDRTWLTSQLISNNPPSGCNINASCPVTVKLFDTLTGALSDGYALTFPAVENEIEPSPASISPSITNAGVNTGYNPWVVWLTGTNLNKNLSVKVYDGGVQWGQDLPFTLSSDGTWGSFQFPANNPPSRCNIGKSCTVEIRLYETGGNPSNGFNLNLPETN